MSIPGWIGAPTEAPLEPMPLPEARTWGWAERGAVVEPYGTAPDALVRSDGEAPQVATAAGTAASGGLTASVTVTEDDGAAPALLDRVTLYRVGLRTRTRPGSALAGPGARPETEFSGPS